MTLVLASRSPQRRAILQQLGVPFVERPVDVVEEDAGVPEAVAAENALRKALAAGAQEGEVVLGVDTPDPVVNIINGRGSFFYLHKGNCVKGTWSKGAVTDLFQFTLSDGGPLRIAPGRTFFELPQIDANVQITP